MNMALINVHGKLGGGVKNGLIFSVGFAVVVVGLIIMTERFNSGRGSLEVWCGLLFGIQALVLGLVGAGRISGEIQRDVKSNMIESHRLMPITAWEGVLGYSGGLSQLAMVGAVNLILQVVVAGMGGMPIDRLLTANVVLVMFCIMLWTLSAACSFSSRRFMLLFGVTAFIPAFSQGTLMLLFPAMGLLYSPMSRWGFAAFASSGGMGDWLNSGLILVFFMQAAMTAILFYAALRQYRQPDQLAFPSLAALLLLTLWAGGSAAGWAWREEIFSNLISYMGSGITGTIAFYCTAVSTLVFATVPLYSAATAATAAWRVPAEARAKVAVPWRGREIPAWIVILIATLLPMILITMLPADDWELLGTVTLLLTLAAYMVGVYAFTRMLLTMRNKIARGLIAAYVIGLVGVAPVLDLIIRSAANDGRDSDQIGLLATLSPLGTMIAVFDTNKVSPFVGIGVQLLLAGVMVVGLRRFRRKTAMWGD